MTVQLLANAKINPTLRVLGRREDGYHELVTTMLALDVGDAVTVTAAETDALDVDGPFATSDVPTDGTNLALRGAGAAREVLGGQGSVRVSLTKRLPSRAGLGGGSADAAAAARATRLVLHVEADDVALDRAIDGAIDGALGVIGSDCAFFHAARATGAALATGTGADITPLTNSPRWYVALVVPAIECATADVYRALGRAAGGMDPVDVDAELEAACALFAATARDARALLVNDLEAPARSMQPGLDDWCAALATVGCEHFRLAGSGSALFGLFDEQDDARASLERIEAEAHARGLGVRFTHVARAAGSALTPETNP